MLLLSPLTATRLPRGPRRRRRPQVPAGARIAGASAAAATTVALLLGGCTATSVSVEPEPELTSAPEASGDGVLRIGVLAPSGGPSASQGLAQTAAVHAAAREINAAGGVLGAPVEIVVRTTGDASAELASQALAELIERGVDAVVGPVTAGQLDAVLPAAASAGIPLVSPAASEPITVADDGGWLFHAVPVYPAEASAFGPLLAEAEVGSVALVLGADELSGAILEPLSLGLDAESIRLVGTATAPVSTADVPGVVAEVAATGADAVLVASRGAAPEVTAALAAGLRAHDLAGPRLWLSTRAATDFSATPDASALEGVHALTEGSAPDDALASRIRREDPAVTDLRTATEAYDAVVALALAALVAEDDGGDSVRHGLRSLRGDGVPCSSFGDCAAVLAEGVDFAYDGASGELSWDARGELRVPGFDLLTYDATGRGLPSRASDAP